uniref:Exonuclease domain-containing protein n=1 Tax=Syphacia muris TaxID=451379 RepID=A0A0N5AUX6_9BILA
MDALLNKLEKNLRHSRTTTSEGSEETKAQHAYRLMKLFFFRGNRSAAYERLKKYVKENEPELLKISNELGKTERFFDFLIVIDFECTCDEINNISYPHSIIEFPAVLINVKEKEIVDTFRSYVRPSDDEKISPFCTYLTGIRQVNVSNAPTFSVVMNMFRDWMRKNEVTEWQRYAFVSDGPWDFAKFLQMQCEKSNIPIPDDFRRYVNIRKTFHTKYCKANDTQRVCLTNMLRKLDMTFEGRRHCGLDDAKNIAKIVLRMLFDDVEIRVWLQ